MLKPKIVDFAKERDIQKISGILRTWLSDSVSFLLRKLERPPQVLKAHRR